MLQQAIFRMLETSCPTKMRLKLGETARVLAATESIRGITGFSCEDWLSSRISLRKSVYEQDRGLIDLILSPD